MILAGDPMAPGGLTLGCNRLLFGEEKQLFPGNQRFGEQNGKRSLRGNPSQKRRGLRKTLDSRNQEKKAC